MPRGWNIAAIKPLPTDLLDDFLKSVFRQEVLPYCDIQSLGRLICVSKRLKSIVDDESLWKQRLQLHWGATDSDIAPIKQKYKTFRESYISVYLVGIYHKLYLSETTKDNLLGRTTERLYILNHRSMKSQ